MKNRKLQPSMLTEKRKEKIFIFLMMLWPVIHVLVFWFYPNIRGFIMPFQRPDDPTFTWVNFERFFREFEDPYSWIRPSIRNSLILFVFSTFVNFPLCLFFMFCIYKKCRGYKAFRVIFYLPAIIGGSVMTALYRYIIHTDGPVEMLLDWLGVEYSKQLGLLGNPETAFPMILLYAFWTSMTSNMVILLGAMHRVPEELMDSAKIDGANLWQEFTKIMIPAIWPTLSVVLLTAVGGIAGNSASVMLLAPNEPQASNIAWFMTKYIKAAGSGTGESLNYPAAVGLIIGLFFTPIVLLVKRLLEKVTDNIEY